MSARAVPFLMFGGRAEEAMRSYVSLFPEARVVEIARDDQGAAGAEGGEVLMPRDNYGFSKLFAWVADKFGVSWQLNLG